MFVIIPLLTLFPRSLLPATWITGNSSSTAVASVVAAFAQPPHPVALATMQFAATMRNVALVLTICVLLCACSLLPLCLDLSKLTIPLPIGLFQATTSTTAP